MLLDFVARQGCGEEDAGVTLAIIQIDRDDEFLLGETLNISEVSASAIGKGVAGAVRAGAASPNAIWEGERQQWANAASLSAK